MTTPKIPRETPPSEREALRAEQKKEQDAQQRAAQDRLLTAMAVTFGTADGKIVLEWIRKRCKHNVSALTMVGLPGAPSPELTLYTAFQQALYLDMRVMIPREILKEVEYD